MPEPDAGDVETPEAVAIVGIAGRFPGARTPEDLWRNLCEGVESVTVIPDDELLAAGADPALLRDPRYVRARGRLAGVEDFDPAFFGMSLREAEIVDPQHRLFLECAWEALERAGYDPDTVPGPVAVYAGASPPGYLLHHVHAREPLGDLVRDLPALLGNDKDHLTTRVAYKLNLRGPAVTVQTACSTGLVAVHLACKSLLSYECDLALAGAVSIQLPLHAGYLYQEGNIASPDGHCRAFDAKGRGAVGGDGAAVVVLKRLSEALADGDHVHAVILAGAVNNDGAAKVGYAAPSIDGQSEVIAMAHALARVSAETIGYVEAHGTGTALGDPIEIAALTRAFRATTDARGTCAVGSIKTNLGHLNTAAGIAGLVKAALALEHAAIPPSLHFETANPEIDFAASPFRVSTALRSWEPGPSPRRAGVSSFGIGGTNAHLVLEEAPARPSRPRSAALQIVVLSARSEAALESLGRQLADHLEARPDLDLADVAFTLQVGRRAFDHRRFVIGSTPLEVAAALRAGGRERGVASAASVAFLFPGQGAPGAGRAAELHRTEPVFQRSFDRCAEILAPRLGMDLRAAHDDGVHLDPLVAQATLFATEYALAQLWMSWGVRPAALLGHSVGEYVAACLAGVFSLEDALALVATRGHLMRGLPAGAMLAVPLGEREARRLDVRLSLAAVNGPASCVVSGPADAIEQVERRLAEGGTSSTRLHTARAFHSAMMDPILDPFREALRAVRRSPPSIPYLSNVTGTWVTAAEATDPEHWIRHLRGTVRFSEGLAELYRTPGRVLLEVGPGRSLSALAARRRERPATTPVIACLRSDTAKGSDGESMLQALGRLWIAGVPTSFRARTDGQRRRVPLPTYPFERQRCWIDPPRARRLAPGALAPAEPLPDLDEAEARITASLAIRPLESYPGLEAALDAYCAAQVASYLQRSGVDTRRGARHRKEDLARRLAIQPSLARLFDALLAILAEDGIISLSPGEIVFQKSPSEIPAPETLRPLLDAGHPELRGIYDLVDHCVARYPDALSGRTSAIGVLYPDGSPRLVEATEQRTVEHRSERVYIGLLVEAVTRLAASRPEGLRILEIGGGRGTLTWPLVEALGAHRVAYCFTDLGRVFVDDAAREAVRRGLDAAMTFRLLDISAEPREQGFEPGSFDVIVAFNVVHAARDVPRALRHLAGLLAPRGVMGLVEVVRTRRWDTLTWGLAEGWWHFDDALRTDSPLLALDTWTRALEAAGLEDAVAYPRGPEARARRDHGLVLARRGEGAIPARDPRPAPAGVPALQARPALDVGYVAPRNDVERRVAAICAEVLGVERVGVRDDLFDLGADSLVTLRIMDRLRRDASLVVPASAAFRGATVERIAGAVAGSAPGPDTSSPLVPLQPAGSRPPIFFVHPAAGVVFPYVQLSRELGPDQPFYGLQARGLDGDSAPDQTIEDMARCYVDALRKVQPEGPYHLGGFSFGCLVAFEMAHVLTRAGEEVALLALVDEPAPIFGHRPSSLVMAKLLATGIARSIWPHLHDYFYLVNAARHADPGGGPRTAWMDRLSEGKLLEELLARSTMANFVPRESRLLTLRQPAMLPMFQLFMIHLRETMAYEPRAYPGRITLFRVTRLGGRHGKDPTMGWGVLAAGGVDVHEVAGEHLTVLRQPHVKGLAAALGESLAGARIRSSRGAASGR